MKNLILLSGLFFTSIAQPQQVIEVCDDTITSQYWIKEQPEFEYGFNVEPYTPFDQDENRVYVHWTDTGTYLITAKYISGNCYSEASKEVKVVSCTRLFFPNSFTPNGDNLNDSFTPKGINVSGYWMVIFDRWGKEVYETQLLSQGWNGNDSDGNPCPSGVFVYKVIWRDTQNKWYEKRGSFTLIL